MGTQRYSILYSSKTGNTKKLAEKIREVLPEENCDYFGTEGAKALSSDILYIGFWTDIGNADPATLAALSACGASGVAGGSLLLIPMACSLFGISDDISMQVVAVGFIIGVVQDSVETALNSSSDLLLSASAEFRQWRLEGKEIKFK